MREVGERMAAAAKKVDGERVEDARGWIEAVSSVGR